MENTLLKFEKQLLCRYWVQWNPNRIQLIESDDVPEWFRGEVIDDWAIITVADQESLKWFENYLMREGLQYFDVRRESTSQEKEITKGFLITGIREERAKELALMYGQSSIVVFSMKPDLHIEVISCRQEFEGLRLLFFKYED
jgi:hypothetical protein